MRHIEEIEARIARFDLRLLDELRGETGNWLAATPSQSRPDRHRHAIGGRMKAYLPNLDSLIFGWGSSPYWYVAQTILTQMHWVILMLRRRSLCNDPYCASTWGAQPTDL